MPMRRGPAEAGTATTSAISASTTETSHPVLCDRRRAAHVDRRDVPAITSHTHPQEEHRRRRDGNRPDDRYRVYEVAGGAHGDIRALGGIGDLGCTYEVSRFPMHHLFKSTLERLDAWAARDETPPRSKRLKLDRDGAVKLDRHGNPVAASARPTPRSRRRATSRKPAPASSAAGSSGGPGGLRPAKLASLYRSQDQYVRKVTRVVKKVERKGWLLPADARAVREAAAGSDIP